MREIDKGSDAREKYTKLDAQYYQDGSNPSLLLIRQTVLRFGD